KRRIVSRAAGDVHERAAPEIEARRGAVAVRGNLEMLGAAEQSADLARSAIGVRRDDFLHLVVADAYIERRTGQLVERLPIDIRDQIAEAVDAQNLPLDALLIDRRLRDVEHDECARRSSERGQLDAFRKPGRRGREPIAAFE